MLQTVALPLSYISINIYLSGIEPELPRWQRGILPLDHRYEGAMRGLEPRPSAHEADILPLYYIA